MARTAVTRSVSGETEPEAHNARNRADETKELDEWWGTVLEIATQIEPLELRRKFLGVVKDGREAKRQCAELLNDKKECEVKFFRYRVESTREQQQMRQEIVKLKGDFDVIQRQNTSLQQQLRAHDAVRSRDKAPAATPRKRQRVQSPDREVGCSEDPPHAQVADLGLHSRERIRDALGGADRGWGSMRSRTGIAYTHHVLLDVGAHLFGQNPSREQDVAEAVFGFGLTDNEVTFSGIVFPLFVRNPNETRTSFAYLGNYAAVKLDPVPWERLSKEGKDCAVQTVLSKGLSSGCSLRKLEKGTGHLSIRHQFQYGIYKVPCSRLEFRVFDGDLNVEIQNSPARRGG